MHVNHAVTRGRPPGVLQASMIYNMLAQRLPLGSEVRLAHFFVALAFVEGVQMKGSSSKMALDLITPHDDRQPLNLQQSQPQHRIVLSIRVSRFSSSRSICHDSVGKGLRLCWFATLVQKSRSQSQTSQSRHNPHKVSSPCTMIRKLMRVKSHDQAARQRNFAEACSP